MSCLGRAARHSLGNRVCSMARPRAMLEVSHDCEAVLLLASSQAVVAAATASPPPAAGVVQRPHPSVALLPAATPPKAARGLVLPRRRVADPPDGRCSKHALLVASYFGRRCFAVRPLPARMAPASPLVIARPGRHVSTWWREGQPAGCQQG